MKIKTSTLLFLLLISLKMTAQNHSSIKGKLADTSLKINIANAGVIILNARDSILKTFVFTDNEGKFQFDSLSFGNYILITSFPNYADYVEKFTLDSLHKDHDFGVLKIFTISKLLNEVIIKGKVAGVKIKSDTIEFNAKAYVIQPNDRVEDLLRQFPGIQIDQYGTIKAQGKTITKVLLDGEEFFGDDPTLITKNIRADMVDKVQLYDKKEDNGEKIKTLNIKLKEDRNKGRFGKIAAAFGTDGYYDSQAFYNEFRSKEKFAVYGTLANTGRTGLSRSDYQSLTNENFDTGSDDLNYDNSGKPIARTGGAHFDNKWNSDKESINGNIRVGFLSTQGSNITQIQNNLPLGVLNVENNSNFNRQIFRENLDANYLFKLNDFTTIQIFTNAVNKDLKSDVNYISNSKIDNNSNLNNNERSILDNGNQKNINLSTILRRSFNKARRSFSVYLYGANEKKDINEYIKSKTIFYNGNGIQDSLSLIDQFRSNITKSSDFYSSLTFIEPISNNATIRFIYSFRIVTSSLNRQAFDKSINGFYNSIDTSLSNLFTLNQLSNQIGAILNFTWQKTRLSVGTKTTDMLWKQNSQNSGNYNRQFINWFPEVTLENELSKQASLEIYYNGNPVRPTIDQLQPVKININPLNITIGNPNLMPSFTNKFSFFYNSFMTSKDQSINISGTLTLTSNPIINNQKTDSIGRSTTTLINLDNKKIVKYYLGGSINRGVGNEFKLGFGLNTEGNTNYSYINSALANSSSINYQAFFTFSKYLKGKYDFRLLFGPTYYINQSSIYKLLNGNGNGYNGNGTVNIYFPGNIKLFANFDYLYNSITSAFDQSLSKLIINSALSKSFFKESSIKISFSVNDLLNQNTGFNRFASGNTITQNSFSTIKRYFLLSATWDFNKTGGNSNK